MTERISSGTQFESKILFYIQLGQQYEQCQLAQHVLEILGINATLIVSEDAFSMGEPIIKLTFPFNND